jgi:hypothetical protein
VLVAPREGHERGKYKRESGRMSIYNLALFVHVVGAIGIFAGMGAFVFGVAALRRAQRVEQVRLLTALILASSNLVVGSIVVLGIAGFYMAITVWGIQATWIVVATVSFLLLIPLGLLIIGPRIQVIAKEAREAPDGPLPEMLAKRTRDPALSAGLYIYVSVPLGIVFLMTNKPSLEVSIIAMVVATVLGLASGLPLWRAARARSRDLAMPARRL